MNREAVVVVVVFVTVCSIWGLHHFCINWACMSLEFCGGGEGKGKGRGRAKREMAFPCGRTSLYMMSSTKWSAMGA